jgi:tRNA-specific 2-thiouridylase
MSKRVVLAMSGGVDSSVAALLLKQQGYEVIGLFMRTGVHVEDSCETNSKSHKKGCCSSLDAADARRVADRLDIPFYALDFADDFDRIMDYFVEEYAAGRTPNPCVVCNNWLKFGKLWSYGKQLDADYIATGHYAQIIRGEPGALAPGGPNASAPGEACELHMAADPAKDQSYVLFGIRRQILSRVLFPVGGFAKERIRALAKEAALPVFNKPDSQEICFVPDGDYAAFIRRRRPELATAGQLVDTTGRVLAEHDGIEQFTIGQRKGLGYAAGERRYVLQIVPVENRVVIGTRQECLSSGLIAKEVNWLIEPPSQPLQCRVKIRYRSQPVPATVEVIEAKRACVVFGSPQLAVTPGQAAVFYEGPRVLGGGWIEGVTA